MDTVYIIGMIEGVIKVNIIWIKKMDLGHLCGVIKVNTKENGKMDISTDKGK